MRWKMPDDSHRASAHKQATVKKETVVELAPNLIVGSEELSDVPKRARKTSASSGNILLASSATNANGPDTPADCSASDQKSRSIGKHVQGADGKRICHYHPLEKKVPSNFIIPAVT